MLTGHCIMQITGGPFNAEQPTLAHFQLGLLSVLLRPSLCPKVVEDIEKTRRTLTRTKDVRKLSRRKPGFKHWKGTRSVR